MTHHHDQSPGPHDRPGDYGPPDWFAAVAEPEPEEDYGPPDWFAAAAEPPPQPQPWLETQPRRLPQSEDRPEATALPELVRASELPSGRRRRRSAVAEETAGETAGETSGVRPSGSAEAAERREPRRVRKAQPSAPRQPREPGEPREPRRPRAAKAEETADPATRAREICLRLLTGTAKTRKQLADALRKREIPDEVAEEVLTRFEEVGLIDDAAYARAWVEERHAHRGLSRRALAQELRTRGVAGELAEQALAQVDADDETEAARALVERKLRATRGLERDTRMRRLVGMLARRGYGEGLAFRVVKEALSAEGEETEGDW